MTWNSRGRFNLDSLGGQIGSYLVSAFGTTTPRNNIKPTSEQLF